MLIEITDINEDVSVDIRIGEIPIDQSHKTVGYLKISGTYKHGCAGSSDAHHIVGMMAYAQARMEWVLDGPPNPEGVHLAILVGPSCVRPLSRGRTYPLQDHRRIIQQSHD